ncbi:hypothetical protein [Pajaroellobacter abortibovis]|uniref:Uncharacterized protein n=1 Tax=Pajaroellobacter abortibovis TaxID=1882918 RepID=A0A1L6MV72_9BACT|nr:hypothetical protein [Pajaroellobacter abortibovis]APR99414.1 hypothetical protein BCY86_01000 [Pajaroellobacter abortibovis]
MTKEKIAQAGMALDPIYTAKAFTSALHQLQELPPQNRPRSLLYWHTLADPLTLVFSSAHVKDAPLDVRLKRLFDE